MIAGPLMLPDGMVGKIEASMTRKPVDAMTRSRGSTTAPRGSGPIMQVPHGWKIE